LTIEALRALARNKVRTALAMLAITFGVATVIWFVAIGKAGRDGALAEFDKLGDNLIWLEAGSRQTNGVRTGAHGMTTLTVADAAAIRAECPLVARVSENVDGNLQLIGPARNWNSHYRGVAPEYREIRAWQVASGEFFTADHVAHFDHVIVIGETVRRELFDDGDGVGEHVRLHGATFEVIGVLAAKGPSATGQDQDDTVMMPWTTAQRYVTGKDVTWLDDILISAASTEQIADATREVAELIRERHHIAVGGEDDFNIRHPEELLKARLKSTETLGRLLLVIASIALVVGGIGIMNMMLASVAQRTREIGLRGAVGARPSAIRIQFLGEAVMLTAIGGVLGVALANAAAPLIADRLGWPMAMSVRASVLACGFAVAVGVAFGLYPASRAARLDPIDALRTE
jgi:putative ABC transport system permease protein